MNINNSSTYPAVGATKFDVKSQRYFIFDGKVWIMMFDNHTSIFDLCRKHPGLKELKQELDEAQEKFDAYLALVRIKR